MAESNDDVKIEKIFRSNIIFPCKKQPTKLKGGCCHFLGQVINGIETLTKSYIRSLIRDLSNKGYEKRFKALKTITKIFLSQRYQNAVDNFINSELVPLLVEYAVEFENPPIMIEATYIIALISSGTTVQIEALLSEKVEEVLELLTLMFCDYRACNNAFWALGNIICESPQLRDMIITNSFLEKLVNFVDINMEFTDRIVWIIDNISPSSNMEPPVSKKMLSLLLPTLDKMIKNDRHDIIIFAIRTISQIICSNYDDYDFIQSVIHVGLLTNLVPLLLHKVNLVQLHAICALGNIASGTDNQTQSVLDTDALLHFPYLLSLSNEEICQEALSFLSCIASGNELHIQAIIDTDGLILKIVMHLTKGTLKTRISAAMTMVNLTLVCNKEQLNHIICAGVIEPLCAHLIIQDNDVITVALKCLGYILKRSMPDIDALTDIVEECRGLERIEQLQDHENVTIYKLSYDLIQTYFSEESA